MEKDILTLPEEWFKYTVPRSLILATAKLTDFLDLYYDTEAEVSTTVDTIRPYGQYIHFSEIPCTQAWATGHMVLSVNTTTGKWRWRVAYKGDYP